MIRSVSAQTAAFWPILGFRQLWKGLGSLEPGQGFRNIIEQGSNEQVVFICDGTSSILDVLSSAFSVEVPLLCNNELLYDDIM